MSADVLTDTSDAASSARSEPPILPPRRAREWATVREYGWLTAAVALVVGLVLRPWSPGWNSPIVYGNDTLSHLAMLEGVGLTGTARGTSELGAPYGLAWTDFPLGPDRVHLIVFRLIRLLDGGTDRMLSLNLYMLLGFFLVAWASFAVLRALRITPMVAGAVSIVFTIAPYHFARATDGHLFLAAYFAVPLGVLLAIWSSDGHVTRSMPRRRWLAVATCVVLVGSSSAYYAAFSMVIVAALGLAVAVRRADWRALIVPAVLAASIGTVVVANTAGTLWTNRSIGVNAEVAARSAYESDEYGLRLTQMVAPIPTHRVPAMADLGRSVLGLNDAGEIGSAIGLLSLLGLGCVAVACVRLVGRGPTSEQDSLMARLGVMVVGAIAVATMGGLSYLVAILGLGQIRVWSRMSIVISYLGLVGLAVVLDRVRKSELIAAHRVGAPLLAVAIVTIAVFDQTPPDLVSERKFYEGAIAVDREAASQMESALPAGAQVFELPYTGFLFASPAGELPLYGLLGPWAAGDGRLDYSAAGMHGRGADWQLSWTTQPPEVMMPGLAAAGFDAVYLDRRSELGGPRGNSAQGSNTASESAWLRRAVGPPTGRVADGSSSREWFDLRGLRQELAERWGPDRVRQIGEAIRRPIGVTFAGAADRFSAPDGGRLFLADTTITLRDEAVGSGPVRVRFALTGTPGSTVEITAAGQQQQFVLDDDPTPVELELPMDRRDNSIRVTTDGTRLFGPGAQYGDVRLRVSQVQVIDAGLDDAITAGEFDTSE